MAALDGKLTRIGIFYDGNFFFHVSNYYHYHHERRARISIGGLHAFVRQQVADCKKTDPRYCQIVDAHYFRGRLRAADAEDRDLLYKERVFDDVLVREGVTTHYLPLSRKLNTLGTRVMVLGWDFKYVDHNGIDRETRTAQVLLDEVTYPIMMHPIIDDRARFKDPLVNGLFVPRKESSFAPAIARPVRVEAAGPRVEGDAGLAAPSASAVNG